MGNLPNGNSNVSFNNFTEVPYIPYKIIKTMRESTSVEAENFWKCLKYTTTDALDKPNLTEQEKKALIWKGNDSIEDDYQVFLKPLIGSQLTDAQSQTQLRLFRYGGTPTNRMESILLYEFDIIVNEKASMIYYNNILCARDDVMEAMLLSVLNGRDIGIGQNYLRYDRELSRTCQSLTNISNSKSFFGKSLVMGLLYKHPDLGGGCGV